MWIKVIWCGLLLHPRKLAMSCHSQAELTDSFMSQEEVFGTLSFSVLLFSDSTLRFSLLRSLIRMLISQGK